MFTRTRLQRWTDALRANPEQQETSVLANDNYTKFCCLGKLCEIEGIPRRPNFESCYDFWGTEEGDEDYEVHLNDDGNILAGQLAKEFGHNCGDFGALGMPKLVYNGIPRYAATEANDNGVPWPVIAEHFDKYYPVES